MQLIPAWEGIMKCTQFTKCAYQGAAGDWNDIPSKYRDVPYLR